MAGERACQWLFLLADTHRREGRGHEWMIAFKILVGRAASLQRSPA
jgi:hypothetical protein